MWLNSPDVSETLHSEGETLKPSFGGSHFFGIFRVECSACSDTKFFYSDFIFTISLFSRTFDLERSSCNQAKQKTRAALTWIVLFPPFPHPSRLCLDITSSRKLSLMDSTLHSMLLLLVSRPSVLPSVVALIPPDYSFCLFICLSASLMCDLQSRPELWRVRANLC